MLCEQVTLHSSNILFEVSHQFDISYDKLVLQEKMSQKVVLHLHYIKLLRTQQTANLLLRHLT